MKFGAICLLVLAVVACAAGQSEDELRIPEENDNQFPSDHNLESDGGFIEGSGVGAIEEPIDVTFTTEGNPPLLIEDVLIPDSESDDTTIDVSEDTTCPSPCVCHFEGGTTTNFVVDCSGYDLTDFPKPLDTKTTTLNIQNNKLTEIPKELSSLKNLKILNADSNSIMDLAPGSISELPELNVLKLGNNRLIEYPKDLKNSFGLSKLEELDLGGNDMRTELNKDIFSHFKSLKKITLPAGTKDLAENLCTSLKDSLATVCTESCSKDTFECSQTVPPFEDDLLNIILPGAIALSSSLDENLNAVKSEASKTVSDKVEPTEDLITQAPEELELPLAVPGNKAGAEFNLRSAVNKAPEGISPMSTIVEAPIADNDNKKDQNVAVGATTSGNKSGGVDKSVIGIIVAGMVLVVAGITIKKNWSSIRNKFSSTPRAANERPGVNANGTAPEEVPLQEKSPV